MRYAFRFDAAACTGCKACQVACKDKNQLPAGVLWRRVYEVSGGEWHRQGAAWAQSVFAYNVSLACNHCLEPACVDVCPARAYSIRPNGIVVLDSSRCMGCEYCGWACPFGGPQFSPETGRTTKCDFCVDLLEEGLPPACVAACPMRALELVQGEVHAHDVPFPLPATTVTRPQISIAQHPAMASPLAKDISNREEVHPRPRPSMWGIPLGELPLVGFSLLGQAAAGVPILAAALGVTSRLSFLVTGFLIAAAGVTSLLHLGTATNAWRAPTNVLRSSLSREVAWLVLMAVAWLAWWLLPAAGPLPVALCGIGFVDAMARVYRLEAVPPWNTWRTPAAFALSTLLLGGALLFASGPVSTALAVLVILEEVARRALFYRAAHARKI